MQYKVTKLPRKVFSLPHFNVKEESEDICKLCKIEVPQELNFIGPVCIGDAYIDLCPRCSKGIRNLMLRQAPDALFPSNETNKRYNQFISWLIQEGKE